MQNRRVSCDEGISHKESHADGNDNVILFGFSSEGYEESTVFHFGLLLEAGQFREKRVKHVLDIGISLSRETPVLAELFLEVGLEVELERAVGERHGVDGQTEILCHRCLSSSCGSDSGNSGCSSLGQLCSSESQEDASGETGRVHVDVISDDGRLSAGVVLQ